jgi:MFS family permease
VIATRRTPPFAFFFLNVCVGWPVGVVGLALSNALVRSGFTVGQIASIVASASLPFTLQFLWGPIVDSSATRRRWFLGGTLLMCVCLAALLSAPWKAASVHLLAMLAFLSCLGAALGAAATKGLIAHHVRAEQLASASGWYISGGGFSHAVAGAGTLWLLTHVTSRPLVAVISAGAAALAAVAIILVSPEKSVQLREFPVKVAAALSETWSLICTRKGLLVALLCVVPFGSGGAAGLLGAIAPEWSVGPDFLVVLGAFGGVVGPLLAGWLSARLGAWTTYIILGWILIATAIALAVLPHQPIDFAALELLYRGLARAGTAALLVIVMTTIGKGAASTKASALWGLGNLTAVYPDLIEGAVHDRAGSASAMLGADAGLALAGYIVLLITARLFKIRLHKVAPTIGTTQELSS